MRSIPAVIKCLMRSYSSSGHNIDDITDRFPGYTKEEVMDAMHLRYRIMQMVEGKPKILSSFSDDKIAVNNLLSRVWD